MKFYRYIPVLLSAFACDQHSYNSLNAKPMPTEKISEAANKADETITGAVAVIVTPSARLVAKVKKENPNEGDYDTLLDDDVNYMSESEHYLDSLKIRKIQRQSEGFVKFKTIKGAFYKIRVDTVFFGILLFNGFEKPIEADIVDIKPDVEKYMLRTP